MSMSKITHFCMSKLLIFFRGGIPLLRCDEDWSDKRYEDIVVKRYSTHSSSLERPTDQPPFCYREA